MSVINKEPFIKKLLKTLTDQELKSLQNLIDGKGTRTVLKRTMNPTLNGGRVHITASDKGVHLCNLQLEYSLFDGYLIYNNSFCVLIYFTDAQVLGMFNIDVAKTKLATVDEALSVVEFRAALDTMLVEKGELVSVQVDDIDSGSEEAGKVIVSDGNGGAIWGNSVEEILEADKDILSKIVVTYDEDSDTTMFNFPVGIAILSFKLNSQILYLKNVSTVVDMSGQQAEGYDLSEYYVSEDETYLEFNGDLSEQVVNGLSYYNINGSTGIINNTYNLFFPASGGTKLYRHQIKKNGSEILIVISTRQEAYDRIPGTIYFTGVIHASAYFQSSTHHVIEIQQTSGTNYKFIYISDTSLLGYSVEVLSTDTISDTVTEL